MTLTVELPPELAKRLRNEAGREGLAMEALTLRLLDEQLVARARGSELVELLQGWIDEKDSAEDRETGEYLIEALDADRPSHRKLFPAELRGKTW